MGGISEREGKRRQRTLGKEKEDGYLSAFVLGREKEKKRGEKRAKKVKEAEKGGKGKKARICVISGRKEG